MTSRISISEKDSGVQHAEQRFRCPECGGRVRTRNHETYCVKYGLVVVAERFDDTPTNGANGPTRRNGPEEWSVEPTTEVRVKRGLGGTFNLGKDGRGRPLSAEKRKRLGRMRRLDKRMTNKEKRLNEAMRDAELIGENLGLPEHVIESAARVLRQASAENLPGGRMSWEALAGGAIALQARDAGVGRDLQEVAVYAKASHERVCAGARKLRLDLNLDVPPARTRVVDNVLAALGDAIDDDAAARLGRVGCHVVDLGDRACIGSGTPRQTVGTAAVYAADRLTPSKQLTQAEVVDAGSTIVDTSLSRIRRYSRELHDAYVAHHDIETVAPGPWMGQ